MTNNLLITSAYSVPLNGETPAEIMYMPAGRSTIRANVNGKPKEIKVNVTPASAQVLQASLAELLTEPVSPFIDFDHKSEAAAAMPASFSWTDEGVMMSLEWTSAGKSAVEGKAYRYFSPTFLLNEAGEPAALPPSGPVGALTNNPAFRRMKQISASEEVTTGDEAPNQKDKTMADETADTVTAALRTELDSLRSENKALREAAETQRIEAVNREAELLIEAAVREGKLAPRNETVKLSLKKWFLVDAEAVRSHLDSLPVNAAFKTIVNVSASHRGEADTSKLNLKSGPLCDSKVRQVMARNHGMSYQDAWNVARAENPEVFESAN